MNKNRIMYAMPTVLFVTGIVGVFVSEALCVTGTLKAEKILKEKKTVLRPGENPEDVEAIYHTNDKGYQESQIIVKCDTMKDYRLEVFKATWKSYIPAVISTTLTVTALIVSNRLSAKQIALLSSAVAGATSLVSKYRDEIRERLGEEELNAIDKKVADKSREEDDTITIYDTFTGVTFETTKMAFVTAKYLLNQTFAMGSTAPLKMFYNIQGADIPYEFETYGWSWEDFNDGYIWIDINLVNKGDHYEMTYDYDPFEGVTQ